MIIMSKKEEDKIMDTSVYDKEQMKSKRLDLEQSFAKLNTKMHEFMHTESSSKMDRKEVESLIQQVGRLNDKLSYWIKYPSPKDEIWFCIRCGTTFKSKRNCPDCNSGEIEFKGTEKNGEMKKCADANIADAKPKA